MKQKNATNQIIVEADIIRERIKDKTVYGCSSELSVDTMLIAAYKLGQHDFLENQIDALKELGFVE